MTLPSSGPLSLQQINNSFALGTDLGTYRGTTRFVPPGPSTSTFSSGAISVSEFYGTIRTFIVSVTGTVYYFNLRNAVISAGWNQSIPIGVICNVNGTILSDFTGAYAFDTGTYPTNSTVIINVGSGSVIAGKGGNGGTGAPSGVCGCNNGGAGGAGGPALLLQTPTWVYNSGTIGGGGGGGGGGGAECSYIWNASAGSGGGGAGFGVGGTSNHCGVTAGRFGGPGGNGSLFGGGAAGGRGNTFTADGGAGGGLGQPGSAGQSIDASGGAGGAAGFAVVGVGNFLGGNWGDRKGPVA